MPLHCTRTHTHFCSGHRPFGLLVVHHQRCVVKRDNDAAAAAAEGREVCYAHITLYSGCYTYTYNHKDTKRTTNTPRRHSSAQQQTTATELAHYPPKTYTQAYTHAHNVFVPICCCFMLSLLWLPKNPQLIFGCACFGTTKTTGRRRQRTGDVNDTRTVLTRRSNGDVTRC